VHTSPFRTCCAASAQSCLHAAPCLLREALTPVGPMARAHCPTATHGEALQFAPARRSSRQRPLVPEIPLSREASLLTGSLPPGVVTRVSARLCPQPRSDLVNQTGRKAALLTGLINGPRTLFCRLHGSRPAPGSGWGFAYRSIKTPSLEER
jgi:hypothetical protein